MIYRNSGGVSGQPPLNFKNYSGSIQDYLIEGNTSQNGTPSPTNPVDVQGCGVRTENLFDVEDVILSYHINNRGEIESKSNRMCTAHNIDLTGISEVTLNFQTSLTQGVSVIFALYSEGALVSRMASVHAGDTIDVSSGDSCLIAFYSSASIEVNTQNTTNIMLNLGSEALPYEPYGYKLPVTINGIEYPIYLGQVPTTRKIRKLVLTGDEDWAEDSAGDSKFFRISIAGATGGGLVGGIMCSHFVNTEIFTSNTTIGIWLTGGRVLRIRPSGVSSISKDDFTAWLASEYSAGHPVTVWYALAEPETAVVNEPLHKIGDYADTISKSQSNLPIPTISGQNTLTIPTTISPSNVSLTLDQKEIEKIYEGGKKEVELSGVPPISFNAIGSQLEDYLIEGNTSQNGTPSPEVPVDVQGCGEMTENLYNSSETQWELGILDDQGHNTGATTSHFTKNLTRVSPNTNYFLSGTIFVGQAGHRIYFYDNSKNWISRSGLISYTDGSFTTPSNCAYIQIQVVVGVISTSDWMLNTGSTALPYEPYGYKLPSTINGTEYPIYLGQVPTTRRIRKLVFNGTENWIDSPASNGRRFLIGVNDGVQSDLAVGIKSYCSHFQIVATGYTFKEDNSYTISANLEFICRIDSSYTLETFKQWLTAQYVNGTPVTVWYVLATPETGIVNEPLHKIGNYADSISKTQSNLPIPITTGSNTLSIETTIQPSNITINYNKQTEIAEVYGGIGESYPIYYMNRTIEGTSPIMFKGLGKDLKDYTILGDTSQNGTPTPEAPVDVNGVGVRTKNLLKNDAVSTEFRGIQYTVNADKSVTVYGTAGSQVSYFILMGDGAATNDLSACTTPIFKAGDTINFVSSGLALQIRYTDGTYGPVDVSGIVTLTRDVGLIYIQVANRSINTTVYPMITLSTETDTDYEPYGYKLPVTINGTEYPIYLEQVPTTRRIKKVVFDGTENWSNQNVGQHGAVSIRKDELPLTPNMPAGTLTILSTHFKAISNSAQLNIGEMVSGTSYLNFDYDGTNNLTVFKAYLAAQYANGTPVTVWYVLAEPETGIVNEPLHKIGNYADTITMAQAGVTIPTVAGANTLTIDTTVQPSVVSITGNIKEVQGA